MFFDTVQVNPEHELLKFADDSKLFSCDSNALQLILDDAISAISNCGLRVAAGKSSVIRFSNIGGNDPDYVINDCIVPVSDCQRDLGVWVDSKAKFSTHCQKISNKANSICFRILRCFVTRERMFLFSIFKTYVRPILECDSPAWSPFYKRDILRVERPQRRFTKMLPNLREYSYLRRLNVLGEETLLVRRIKCDLMLVYKIIHNYVHGLDHLLIFDENHRTR